MKLLFDENLPRSLVRRVADIWPASVHVADHGLGNSDDVEIWNFAGKNQFTIVTKDSDFHTQSIINGAPPKVIWLTIGNCSIQQIEDLLRMRAPEVFAFNADAELALLSLR